jgi:hypothetical protein
MTALEPTHGSIADFELGTTGSPLTGVVISQYISDVTFSIQRDKAEVSAFKDVFKAYVAGLCDLTLTFNGSADQNIDSTLYGLLILVTPSIQYIYYPEGINVGSGTSVFTGTGFIDKVELKTAVNSAYTFSASFQNSGTPTRTTQ